MTGGELLALAERVEGLNGPDRDTNEQILLAMGWSVVDRVLVDPSGNRVFSVPDYTASLDAAMSLVPEGCAPGVYRRDSDDWASMIFGPTWQTVADTRAKTAALVLTAAALRARALATPINTVSGGEG